MCAFVNLQFGVTMCNPVSTAILGSYTTLREQTAAREREESNAVADVREFSCESEPTQHRGDTHLSAPSGDDINDYTHNCM